MFFEAEPSAISYGMTEDQFWRGRPWLFAAYREARRRESEERAWERWQAGAYAYQAIQSNVGLLNPFAKPHRADPWPDEPYGMERPKPRVAGGTLIDQDGRPLRHDDPSIARTHALIIDQIMGHNRK